MPSPFPGMNPYLESESIWPDFHQSFCFAMRAALIRLLPPRYTARLDRNVWLHNSVSGRRLLGRPDVFISDIHPPSAGVAVAQAPRQVEIVDIELYRQPFVLIADRDEDRVVTALELLSPSNKSPGDDRQAYLGKRRQYLRSGTNLVEIDLLRSGTRPPIQNGVPSDYAVLVCEPRASPSAGLWAFSVREVLPTVPVPLDAGIAPVMLDLRVCLDRTYDEAGYERGIDYGQPPEPPLTEADAAWAVGILAARPTSG